MNTPFKQEPTEIQVYRWFQESTINHHIEEDGRHIPKRAMFVAKKAWAAALEQLKDTRPESCRNRLLDEGNAYPKSGCEHCKTGGLTGCPYGAGKCNCGRPLRYTHPNGQSSCNKYEVCLPYERLVNEHVHYRRLSMMYLALLVSIRDEEARDYEYRSWAKKAIELGESWNVD